MSAASDPDVDRMLSDYKDLAPRDVTRLDQPPTSLEMMRHIHASRPVVWRGFQPIRGHNSTVDLRTESGWKRVFGDDAALSIAVTPDGLADSIVTEEGKEPVFALPQVERLDVTNFLRRLRASEDRNERSDSVVYLQSQDGNVYRREGAGEEELARLQAHVVPDVPCLSEALGDRPDAVNVWLGSSRSVTSLHRDPYENAYCVVSGRKIFRLLSPAQGYALEIGWWKTASWRRREGVWELDRETYQNAPLVPWTTYDPAGERTAIQPLEVVVEEGETLYLPAGWWHHVSQEPGDQGLCVAVNYWYDPLPQPDRYALERFAWRKTGRREMVPDDEDEDE